MNKKTKKRIDVLRGQVQKLQQQLAGAKSQCDDPSEIEELQRNLDEAQSELKQLIQNPN